MWRGRAEALFSVFSKAACEDRDVRGETISAADLPERITLQKLLELPQNTIYSQRVRDEAQLFLNDLPGYSAWEKAIEPEVKEQCMGQMAEQFGFLQMQFTEVFSKGLELIAISPPVKVPPFRAPSAKTKNALEQAKKIRVNQDITSALEEEDISLADLLALFGRLVKGGVTDDVEMEQARELLGRIEHRSAAIHTG